MAIGKRKTLSKDMKWKLAKSPKGLVKDGASFIKKINHEELLKGIKEEKKKVCVSGKCFTEDTLVCIPNGYVMIRDIKEGDIVCSMDELTGETGYKKVISISRTSAHTIYIIKVDGDTEIKATAYHPFYVEERGWVNAINLSEGDRLVTEEGTSVITSICKERHEEPVIMYNFHVEDWVSYFVSELKVYVHNKECKELKGGRLIPGRPEIVTGGNSTKLGQNIMESMGLDKNTSWTGYQAHHIVPAELSNHPVLKKIGIEMDDASNGIFLRTRSSEGISTTTRHEGFHSPYNKLMQKKLDNIDLNKSIVEIQEEVYHL